MNRLLFALLGSALLLAGCDSGAPADGPPADEHVFGTRNYDADFDVFIRFMAPRAY